MWLFRPTLSIQIKVRIALIYSVVVSFPLMSFHRHRAPGSSKYNNSNWQIWTAAAHSFTGIMNPLDLCLAHSHCADLWHWSRHNIYSTAQSCAAAFFLSTIVFMLPIWLTSLLSCQPSATHPPERRSPFQYPNPLHTQVTHTSLSLTLVCPCTCPYVTHIDWITDLSSPLPSLVCSVSISRGRPAKFPDTKFIAPNHVGRKCLALDLDETLVHSSFQVRPESCCGVIVAVNTYSYSYFVFLILFLSLLSVCAACGSGSLRHSCDNRRNSA